jgi:DNA-binding CsgD family transcriptional regulator
MVSSSTGYHDDLGLDDYRRIFDVMETVVGATNHTDLCDRLLNSLAREFGWTNAFLLAGETRPRPVLDPCTPPYVIGGMLRICVPAGPGVTATIGVPLIGGRRAGAREHSISYWLGRLLGPSFREHFSERPRRGNQWSLTEREYEIAQLVAAGMTNREIAEHLHVTVDTVKKHITSVLKKTGCRSRTRLAVLWRQPT